MQVILRAHDAPTKEATVTLRNTHRVCESDGNKHENAQTVSLKRDNSGSLDFTDTLSQS